LRFDFLIHVDFVTWLSIYFAVMVPALLLTFAALLYRLLFILAGAPVDSVTLYPKTFAGWLQALTIGHPGFPPTYVFLRNSLISDFVYTSLFLITQALLRPHRASSDLPGHFTHPTV
jgi:hypothetical protein